MSEEKQDQRELGLILSEEYQSVIYYFKTLKSGGSETQHFVGRKTKSKRAGADFVGGISICNLLFQNILVGAQADFVGGKTICNILFQNIKIRRVRGSAFCQKKNNPLLFWQSFS